MPMIVQMSFIMLRSCPLLRVAPDPSGRRRRAKPRPAWGLRARHEAAATIATAFSNAASASSADVSRITASGGDGERRACAPGVAGVAGH